MAQHQVRRLPVVKDGRLVGIVAQADVARHGDDTQTGQVVERIAVELGCPETRRAPPVRGSPSCPAKFGRSSATRNEAWVSHMRLLAPSSWRSLR